ncbi:MAG: hypothetical protein FWC71_06380 [Defluviitaleaceae bacterium]|nr:hypothetical protein [Defluviitaleaceae bacterium]
MPNNPTIEEIYIQYITDDTLRQIAERLFHIAQVHKMKNRPVSYHSFTFTYRSTNVFNITMRATLSNKGVRKIDPTNHFIVQICMGKKDEAEALLAAQPQHIRTEYIGSRVISCGICAGTPEGQAARNLTCDKVLYFRESNETYPLCTINFGYARHNPTPAQYEIIEHLILKRIQAIDIAKAKK